MNDFLFYNNGRQKRAYFCTLVYTLTIYIGFKDNVNFDVILRVKFEPHIQELINYKGALESARIGPVSPVRMWCATSWLYSTVFRLFRYHFTSYNICPLLMYVCLLSLLFLSDLWSITYFVCYSFTSGSFVCSFRYTPLTSYTSLSFLCVCVCVCVCCVCVVLCQWWQSWW